MGSATVTLAVAPWVKHNGGLCQERGGSNNRTKNETSTQAKSTESGNEITRKCTEPGLWLTYLQLSTCVQSEQLRLFCRFVVWLEHLAFNFCYKNRWSHSNKFSHRIILESVFSLALLVRTWVNVMSDFRSFRRWCECHFPNAGVHPPKMWPEVPENFSTVRCFYVPKSHSIAEMKCINITFTHIINNCIYLQVWVSKCTILIGCLQ